MAIKKGTTNIKSIIYGGNIRIIKCYKGTSLLWEKELLPGYIKFSSPSSFTLKTFNTTKNWDGIIEYSTDNIIWNTWSGSTTLSSVNNVLYLRGTNNTYISTASNNRFVLTGTNISCEGSIEALLDYTSVLNDIHPIMASNCYTFMFYGCTSLVSAPKLTALTLTDYCYAYMFYGCTSLTIAPVILATTLADYCCQNMFYNCSSLIQVPILHSTTLLPHCYRSMFENCTSLIQPTGMSAIVTLDEYCCQRMYAGCTSLEYLPKLNATTIKIRSYAYMFTGCSSSLVKTTQSGSTNIPFKIPYTGTGTTWENAMLGMFPSFTPTVNTTYYTYNQLID